VVKTFWLPQLILKGLPSANPSNCERQVRASYAEHLEIPRSAQLGTGRRTKTMTNLSFRHSSRAALFCPAVFLLLFQGAAFGQSTNPTPLSGRPAGNGSVSSTQTAIPGTTTSVNTLNPAIQVQGPYAGSANSVDKRPFLGKLTLHEALERGIAYNLGAIGLAQAVRQSQGQSRVARSALLPNLSADLSETVEQVNLRALIGSPIPGLGIPSVVGPFNYFDLRARLSQTVVDMTAWNNYRASVETVRANVFSSQDAGDMVVLAVGGTYVQVIAAQARVTSARAQLDTASALFHQTSERRAVGLVAQIDVNRSQVQVLTQQQRLVSLQNDLAKQKINLARLTGQPPSDAFELTDDIPFAPAPPITLEDALKQALDQRPDLKAAKAQVRAAERGYAAARAGRLPSLTFSADYGAIGTNPAQSHGTFSVVGSLSVPIWQGGRTEGDIEQADAVLSQRKAETEDAISRIESDVHNAWLDLQAAASQVEVAQKNREVTKETLGLTRQRYEAGVTDNVEVVQAQDAMATAELDYISSVFAHNAAKLSLARALGSAADNVERFLKLK
jgi:outer membrane protein TolC